MCPKTDVANETRWKPQNCSALQTPEPDLEYVLIDGTIVQAHQKASGAKGGLSIRPSGDLVAG